MQLKLSVASALIAGALILPIGASASSLTPSGPRTQSIVEKTQGWDVGRCRAWRRECAERTGWGGERFQRCLIRHGCERHRYGDRWDR
jgi:hypothetical protein